MPRLAAYRILRRAAQRPQATPLREVERASIGMEPRDRGLLRRLIATEIRRRNTLRAMVRVLAPRKPSIEISRHLHIALVQAFFLDRIPDHALRSETLSAVHHTLGPSKVKVARSILIQALKARCPGRSGDPRRDLPGRDLHFASALFTDPDTHPLVWGEEALNLPASLLKRWTRRCGRARAEGLGLLALEEPPLSVRLVGETRREQVLEELAGLREGMPELLEGSADRHARILLWPTAAAETVLASPAFREGRITIQGESALRAAEMVQARAGERILDLCAAPGGKCAVLAEGGAEVTACDMSPTRLERLEETLSRLNLSDRVHTHLLEEGVAPGAETLFDGVLVDAPCSNTGVLAQRPEARWRFSPQSQAQLRELQTGLLERGAALVTPGGRLVWSTCSLESDENGQLLSRFLETHPGWELEEEQSWLPGGAEGPVDGGSAARLRRKLA